MARSDASNPTHIFRPHFYLATCVFGHRPFVVGVSPNPEIRADERRGTLPTTPVTALVTPVCPTCGASAQFVPGTAYSRNDLLTVEQVIEIMHSARLKSRTAREVAQALDWAIGLPTSARVRELLAGYDALKPLLPLVPDVSGRSARPLCTLVRLIRALLTIYAYSSNQNWRLVFAAVPEDDSSMAR